MITKQDFERISDNIWQIPQTYRYDMRAPARLYASEDLLEDALLDESVNQLINTATLPGIVKYAIAMPDIHQGYGFPIGGVVATRAPNGVISTGGVGYDINCGVRLLASEVNVGLVKPYLEDLATAVYQNCPSGVGSEGSVRLNAKQLDEILEDGSEWTRKNNFARKEDLQRTEEYGRMPGASANAVSKRGLRAPYGRRRAGRGHGADCALRLDSVELRHPAARP